MATKSIEIFDDGKTASSWSPTISTSTINSLANSAIPDYATITKATLTLSAKKTISLAKGNIKVYIGGTNVHSANSAVNSSKNYTPTIEITSYIYSGGTNAGCIKGDVKIELTTSGGSTWWDLRDVCINYTYSIPTYTVTWKNHDGSVLETDTGVTAGTTPTYNGSTPTKASTAQYSYTFSGWSPSVGAITGNVTYTAQFTQTLRSYAVTFKDENGATLKTETVNYGSTVTAPSDPVKADTAQHKYTFDGWYDANGNKWYPNTAITGDTVYTARFNSTVQRYTVKWYNEDGSVLLETDELVPYGTIPEYNGATPTKAETAAATYEHIGWSIDVNSSGTTELTAVIEAVNYYARFRAINKTYTVVWKNDDGTVLETDTAVAYGAIPDYNGSTPTKDDEQFNYTFLGWSANVEDPPLDDTELPTVTGNITYTAVYEKTPKIFYVTVAMLTDKGDILGEYLIRVTEYGRELVIEAEENAGYRFVKWADGNTDRFRTITVTASVDYEAIYERTPVPIIVNEEQRVTGVYIAPSTQTIVYVISGEVPAVVANGVTVDGWSFEVSNSVPDNSYPIEKLYINETRVY